MNNNQIQYINPYDVLNKHHESIFYKECFLLFTVAVAGKTASIMADKINSVVDNIIDNTQPTSLFNIIQKKYYSTNKMHKLEEILKENKTGKYNTILSFITDFIKNNIDIEKCSITELEKLKGIGKKSSRFFALYCRKDISDNIAVLDTHVLKFLKQHGVKNVPKTTPNNKLYESLEQDYLWLYKHGDFKGSKAQFDFAIWENKGQLKINF